MATPKRPRTCLVVHMAAATPSPTPPGSLKRIVAASLIGTTIE
ncbi:hypothetical protein [Streptomyces sp. NPDC096068]